MKMDKILYAMLIVFVPILHGCGDTKTGSAPAASNTPGQSATEQRVAAENSKKIEELNHDYPRIPDDKILDNGEANNPIYTELKKRYKDELIKLKDDVESTGAKFVVVIMAPEVGKGASGANRYGIPYIKSCCSQLGIECIDLTPILLQHDAKEITQVPRDGHWSKKGAILVADHLAPVIAKYAAVKSTVVYKDADRPEVFGDLPSNDDEIMDGEKDMPYHVKANTQGIRMAYDIKFPKKKQRVLLLGDSEMFCPFLDNEFTIGDVLQQKFPNSEIMNTGIISYTVDDYLTLWEHNAKYSEPDLVIMGANGADITDLFFTNRNHFSRTHAPYLPSPVEEKYYKSIYPSMQ